MHHRALYLYRPVKIALFNSTFESRFLLPVCPALTCAFFTTPVHAIHLDVVATRSPERCKPTWVAENGIGPGKSLTNALDKGQASASCPLPERNYPMEDSMSRNCVSRRMSPSLSRVGRPPSIGVSYMDPDSVAQQGTFSLDPMRDYSGSASDIVTADMLNMGTFVATDDLSVSAGNSMQHFLPQSDTASSLYRNLLRLMSFRNPPPTLTAILDYHQAQPRDQHSVRSYNLLLSLAIRTSAFGTVRQLFTSMREAGICGNLETFKLQVRWLISMDGWQEAWDRATSLSSIDGFIYNRTRPSRAGPFKRGVNLPLPVWTEFLRTSKRGVFQRYVRILKQNRSCLSGAVTPNPPQHQFATVNSHRYREFMRSIPSLTQAEIRKVPTRVVYFIVWAMLRADAKDGAVALFTDHVSRLPRVITAKQSRACVDIIHLFLKHAPFKPGIYNYHDAHATFRKLISLHPAFIPTSTTLFLLLGKLRRAKQCGTTAYKLWRRFKLRWGPRVEDRRVRRRIISYATKEGRLDIVQTIVDAEKASRHLYGLWQLQEEAFNAAGSGAARSPRRMRKPFRGRGREEWRWRVLMARVRRKYRRRRGA